MDNVKVKKPKIIYNKEKLVSKIWQYIVSHIENLDYILINLKKAKITIFRAKSQFCKRNIKLVDYICNIDHYHLYIFKVLKI